MPPAPVTRYRCGFPGCSKRYASTDGVRKHARKTHTAWLKSVDETSLSRDRETESKPSTYCIAEVDDPSAALAELQPAGMPMMGRCGDVYDDAMPPHLRQASIAAATAFSMSLHSGASMLQPRMIPMLPRVCGAPEPGMHCMPEPGMHSRQMSPSEFSHEAMLPSMTAACPVECCSVGSCRANPWASENLPPHPEYVQPHRDAWSRSFEALMARADGQQQLKRPSPALELEEVPASDPLCLTPPMAPATSAGASQRLSPFELEEKRPSKLAKVSNVPLKPEPLREPLTSLPLDVYDEAPLADVPVQPVSGFSETEYFDFFEALLAM